jgi:hypothetical protein
MARVWTSASGTASETRPMRSASSPLTGLAQQQMVFGLGHAAQQRPDDRGVITAATPSLVWPSISFADFAAIEMSARIASTSPRRPPRR